MSDGPPPLLVLTGTTASGKNRVGARLAQHLDGEVVSLDSMKVYRGMDIGTDKPSADERRMAPHHLVDILDPHEPMNLRRFVDLARAAIADIHARGRRPLVVGGTALYLNGLVRGVFEGPEADLELRRDLKREAEAAGVAALHARLATVDPEAAARIHANDYKRIERALEVWAATGKPISALQGQWKRDPVLDHRLCVLTWDRAVLDRRIDQRVDAMMANGLVDEVRGVLNGEGFGRESSQAVGYKEVVTFLRGEATAAETAELIKARTRRFARSQLTWFRKWRHGRWVHGAEEETVEALVGRVDLALAEGD